MERRRILIVNKAQFGYHVDTYKYCEYLRQFYAITYLCWDYGHARIPCEDADVKYISRQGSKAARYYRFLKTVNQEIGAKPYDLIFMVYFHGASLIRILNWKRIFNVDIRTCSDTRNKLKNFLSDLCLRLELAFFPNISIVSESLAGVLMIRKYFFLPLGGECFTSGAKSYSNANLLYVGTLENRDILKCVRGFHKFLESDNSFAGRFIIIGDSPGTELQEIRDYVSAHNLSDKIKALGYIQNAALHSYFEESTIGVSFVPLTSYYDNQPPTKTYEYLLSGLPVIATKTKENLKIVTNRCGILINDDAESFAAGVREILENLPAYDIEQIKQVCRENLWKHIVIHKLKPYLEGLCEKRGAHPVRLNQEPVLASNN